MENDLPMVRLVWIDSHSMQGGGVWTDKDDITCDLLECVSVGFVFRESDDAITLVSHIAKSQVSGDLCIPKCCIRERIDLGQREGDA